jgi:hypothetical protein
VKSWGMRKLIWHSAGIAFVAAVLMGGFCSAHATGQVGTDGGQDDTPMVGLPFRAPGYELYYHDDSGPAAFANRWGYFDGWTEGRHDRQLGISIDPKELDRYKLAPDHGMHPGLDRERYKSLYRTAYLRGYERGSKP